jgi:hypothetical protein
MPIKSYLAYPMRGRRDDVADAVRALPGCQVILAVDRDLLVVVTDTPDEATEDVLQQALARVEFLEGLALVAGLGDAEADSVAPQEEGYDPA